VEVVYTTQNVLLSFFSGIWASALPMWLFFGLLADVDASLGVILMGLIPVFGIAGAMVFLDETVVGIQWLGIALVLGSTYFVGKIAPDH
jgi:drug/metabolite transporter (DMT)-like permease